MGRTVLRFAVRKTPRQIDAAVRRLVKDAARNVPLFRDLVFAHGIDPAAIHSASDLARLPVLSRSVLAQGGWRNCLRVGVDPYACKVSGTSGTSGIPLDVYMSRGESLFRRVLLLRAIRRNVRLPIPFTIAEVGTGALGFRRRGAHQRLAVAGVVRIPRLWPLAEQAKRLAEAKPDVITGHPSCLDLIVDEIQARSLRIAPRLVVSRGELLTRLVRERLERTFRCKAVDYYNSDEIGNIAWECPQTRGVLHVNTDGCSVDILGEDGARVSPGEKGRVVVTNLFNWTMPFIHYDVGDRAAVLDRGTCACGHRGLSLSALEGREVDYIRTPEGRRVSPRAVDSLAASAIRSEDGHDYFVRRYQVVQETEGVLHVRIVPEPTAPGDLDERIVAAMRRLSPATRCMVERVDEIPPGPSGKLKTVYSKLPPLPGQDIARYS